MANILYNTGKALIENEGLSNLTIRAMLERSTSTYTPDVDHEFVDDLTGFVELSVASYTRKTVANFAAAADNATDRAVIDHDDVVWAALESGQTVKGIFYYAQVGGDDTSPEDDVLIARVDTDASTFLPFSTVGGSFTIQPPATGLWYK